MRYTIPAIFAITLLLGCKKEETPTPASNERYYFTGTIDSNPVAWAVKATDNRTDSSRYHIRSHYFYTQWPLDCTTADCTDLGAGTVAQERNRGSGIEVVFVQMARSIEVRDLKPLFTPGTKSFGLQRTSLYGTGKTGILVRYTENGRVWTSEGGDQTGSTFESLEFNPATTDKDRYSDVWRARFSCKVYFSGLPPKTIQDAEIYGPAFLKQR